MKKKFKYGFDHTTADGQKRLIWPFLQEWTLEAYISKPIDFTKEGDYGCDPIGNGTFKMVPSGDIVDYDNMKKRLKR